MTVANKGLVLVTGATGFVGRACVNHLRSRGWTVRTAARSSSQAVDFRIDLTQDADWSSAVAGCTAVVHLAARAHVLAPDSPASAEQFHRINAAGSVLVARAAAQAGVRQFVFLSSIAASGPMSGGPIRESDVPAPVTDYGRSKLAAERLLQAISADTGLSVIVLRPPLIYGPGAAGRFGQLMDWCYRGIPLPLAGLVNRRSLLAIDNLVDAIAWLLSRPAQDGTFNLADSDDISTVELLRLIGRGMHRPARLIDIPMPLLRAGTRLIGKDVELRKLSETLLVDSSHIAEATGWQPPVTTAEAVHRTTELYMAARRNLG